MIVFSMVCVLLFSIYHTSSLIAAWVNPPLASHADYAGFHDHLIIIHRAAHTQKAANELLGYFI